MSQISEKLTEEKWVSIKEAIAASGYAKDYIGQLCRSGKVRAQMINKCWIVNLSSLLHYKEKTALARKERMKEEIWNGATEKTTVEVSEIKPIFKETRPGLAGGPHTLDLRKQKQKISLKKEKLLEEQIDLWDQLLLGDSPPNLNHSATEPPFSFNIFSRFLKPLIIILIITIFSFILWNNPQVIKAAHHYSGKAVHQIPLIFSDLHDSLFRKISSAQITDSFQDTFSTLQTQFQDFPAVVKIIQGAIETQPLEIGKHAGQWLSHQASQIKEIVFKIFSPSVQRLTRLPSAPPPPSPEVSEDKLVQFKREADVLESQGLQVQPKIVEKTVVERIIERVSPGFSKKEFDLAIQALNNKFLNEIAQLKDRINTRTKSNFKAIALTQRIDTLSNVTLSTITVVGVTGLTDADIPNDITASNYLLLTGGTLTGPLTGTSLTLSGIFTVSGIATSTIAGRLELTKVPTITHSFSSWAPDVAGSAVLDSTLLINPASAASDSNLLGLAVAGSVKFLIDAEGDVFVNSLTSVGETVLSTTTASTFTVENNTTLGDSSSDRLTINARINTDLIPAADNAYDVGTSSLQWRSGYFGTSLGIAGTATITAMQLTAGGAFTIDSAGTLSLNTTNNQNIVIGGGNVGIGTNNPFTILNVEMSNSQTDWFNASNVNIVFTNTDDTAGNLAGIAFYHGTDSVSDRGAGIFAKFTDHTVSSENVELRFVTKSSGTLATRMTIDEDGNIGIGVIDPDKRLEVFETVADSQLKISYDATRFASFQVDATGDLIINPVGNDVFVGEVGTGLGNLIVENRLGVGTTSPTEQFSVANNIFIGGGGAPVLGTATSVYEGDIIILGKLDVGTIDPVYTIGGTKYATYGYSTIGIKEETITSINIATYNKIKGYYEYIVDFSTLKKGSDLWLFYQITDFGKNWKYLIVHLSAGFDGRVFYEKIPKKNQLIILSTVPGEVSFRLVANRFDWRRWPNLRPDQGGWFKGFELNIK
ncbi:hypothetical protein IIA95_03115 [Patescibacteria group bacterium]|nr:hypothetical protein [Patescibacteria group bacterium]